MGAPLQLQFDPNQDYQLQALAAISGLFEGLVPQAQASRGDADTNEIVANLPPWADFNRALLDANYGKVITASAVRDEDGPGVEYSSQMMLAGVSEATHDCPHFTVEMETGTGKTYLYLRAMYELNRLYGFRKYVVVVPSIAIYEGVLKSFQIMRSHFASLYQGDKVNPIPYEGALLSRLRDFAFSGQPQCLVLTLDAFNKASNVIYRASEKLPGERLPCQYVQETRPIVILDEPQNMESERSQQAIATLAPLCVLRFSATHRTSPNRIYALTPFEAFQRGLVKRIEVEAVTETINLEHDLLLLRGISDKGPITAEIETRVLEGGQTRVKQLTLAHDSDLGRLTGRPEHRGVNVREINRREGFVTFSNGARISTHDALGGSREALFRQQIRSTIEAHMERQARLEIEGIKVLSLFFIDRVSNYTAADGLVRVLFDEEFERLKQRYPRFARLQPADVRDAYFARMKAKGGEVEADTSGRTEDERKAEKAAFELIMRDKERLLRIDEAKAFIFAHSALREGWDNPNVFQICTLNQTVSTMKKRQEIGRGLRLCVNQRGERVWDETVNVLTVVANENYRDFVERLQNEYVEDGVTEAPPRPTQTRRAAAVRRDHFYHSEDFAAFWARLSKRTRYRINVSTERLIGAAVDRLNTSAFPEPTITVERGTFTMREVRLTLLQVHPLQVRIRYEAANSDGSEVSRSDAYLQGSDVGDRVKDGQLRRYRIQQIRTSPPSVVFENGIELFLNQAHLVTGQNASAQRVTRAVEAPPQRYPVFNLIERAAQATQLTRVTLAAIFTRLDEQVQQNFLDNPEGFANIFITVVREELANHVADSLEYELMAPAGDLDLETLFPPKHDFPQRELIDAGERGLYDRVQQDSDVERSFVENVLREEDRVVFFFKFPARFKVPLPHMIGNYNPDWGIVWRSAEGQLRLHLVRETKGNIDPTKLRFPNEGRKIRGAEKHFRLIGVDYKHITDTDARWYEPDQH